MIQCILPLDQRHYEPNLHTYKPITARGRELTHHHRVRLEREHYEDADQILRHV